MITTLGLWQIVGLTLLILSLAVILRRLAILIAMVATGNWSSRPRSATSLSVVNHRRIVSNESGSLALEYNDKEGTVRGGHTEFVQGAFPVSEDTESHSLAAMFDAEVDESFTGSTGYSPAGVSYIQAEAVVRSRVPSVLKGRKGKRRGK